MLSEGQRRRGRGTDVVIGFVECHGRQLTEELIDGLEVVPRKAVDYRGTRFEEMDLDAVVRRRPEGRPRRRARPHERPGLGAAREALAGRLEILDAGIDVITTVNIQHLESIADAVEQMTGAQVRERVPDWVVRKADQIELVDSSPEQLRRRHAARQHLPEGEGSAGTHPFLPHRQPHRAAGAGIAVPRRRDRGGAPRAPPAPRGPEALGDDRAHHGGRHGGSGDRRPPAPGRPHRIPGQRRARRRSTSSPATPAVEETAK